MKKISLTIFTILYITATSGFTMNLHYCMGKFVDWTSTNSKVENCRACGMEETASDRDGCCRDESKTVQITQDQNVDGTHLFTIQVPAAFPVPLYPYSPEITCPSGTVINLEGDTSPPGQAVPDYIRNCVFRI